MRENFTQGSVRGESGDRLSYRVDRRENCMERIYYVLWYRLEKSDRCLLWYSNAHDGVWLDQKSKIPTFPNIHTLQHYATQQGIIPIKNETPILHNLDVVRQWLHSEAKELINCQEFLAAWNFLGDVATSLDIDIQELRATNGDSLAVYNKLFHGNNLPAITPPGAHYTPNWNEKEMSILQRVLTIGFKIFQQNSYAVEDMLKD